MLNVGRMRSSNDLGKPNSDKSTHSIGVSATLKTDYSFVRWDGEEVMISEGTRIFVDEDKGIGSHKEYHFAVEAGDYTIDYLN